MEKSLLLSILAGESEEPVTRVKFISFTKNTTRDYENIYFYDVLINYSYCYEKIYMRLYPNKSPDRRIVHLIGQRQGGKALQSVDLESGHTFSHSNAGESSGTQLESGLEGDQISKIFQSSKTPMLKSPPLTSDDKVFEEFFKKETISAIRNPIAFQDWNSSVCNSIIKEFITSEAKYELNIEESLKKIITKQLTDHENPNYTPALFRMVLSTIIVSIYHGPFKAFKQKAILNNIGAVDVKMRFIAFLFVLMLNIALLCLYYTVWSSSPLINRLYLIIPLSALGVTFLQYNTKFCVGHAFKGTTQMEAKGLLQAMNMSVAVQMKDTCARTTAKNYAIKLIIKGTVYGVIGAGLALCIPPYNI